MRTGTRGPRPATEGRAPTSPAPYPSSHWNFRSRMSPELWNASLSMVPAGRSGAPAFGAAGAGGGGVCSGPAYREPGALRRARVPLFSLFLPLEVLCLSIAPAGKCQLLQNSLAQDNSLSLRDSLFISLP